MHFMMVISNNTVLIIWHSPILFHPIPLFSNFFFCFQPRFILEGVLELTDLSENARFGSALAPVSDLNGDSFNDLVVGAPLEDEHRGAIYIYNSQRNRILRKYKQVRISDEYM